MSAAIEWVASLALPSLLGTINLLVVCGNVFVLYILISQKALHTSTNSIVFSLTLSDFMLGCLILPFSIIQEFTSSWHFGTLWCKCWLSLDILLSTASIYNLLAISFDRYMAVKQPIKYGRLISSSRLSKLTISAVWLISAALALPPLLSDLFLVTTRTKLEMDALLDRNHSSAAILDFANTCTPVTNSDPYILFSATISFILPMILMVGLNVSIFCTVLDSKRKLSQSPFTDRSAASLVSAGKLPQNMAADGGGLPTDSALRVHRGGSCRALAKMGTPTDANWHHHQTAVAAKEKCHHRSLNMLKKCSLASNGTQHFHTPRTKPLSFVHQQSLPSTAFHAASVAQHNNVSSTAHLADHQSLPSSRKGTLDSYAALSIAGDICGGGVPRGETFSTSIDSPKSSGGCTTSLGLGAAEVRKKNVRQIWLNRIKRIKMAQQQLHQHKRNSTFFSPSMLLWSSSVSCSDDLRCGSAPLVANMRALMEHEHRLRSIAAVRKQRSAIERTVDRAVWFPAVVTSLFAGSGGAGGAATKLSTTATTHFRRQSERLLLYPSMQLAKNSLRTEMRVARTIAVVVGCFTCCWLPFTIIYVLQAFHLCPVGTCIPDWLFSVSFWLGYANSALNPLLYAAFSRDFRMAFRRILMRDRNSSFRSSG